MPENYFNDVPNLPIEDLSGKIGGSPYFDDLSSLQVGAGTKLMRVDHNGMWLGARTFAAAPFKVDMSGNVTATSASFPNLITLSIFKQDAIPVSLAIGDLWIDTNDSNKMYRAGSVGADAVTAGEWELVNFQGIQVFAQDAVPTSINAGDLWYDTNDSNKVYRAVIAGADQITAGEWVLVNDLRAADALLKAGSSQVLTGDVQLGVSNVKIDGANKRIMINDGTNDRILIGYQSAGF